MAFMQLAGTLALQNVQKGGGPFGAVIVNNHTGTIVATGQNNVVKYNDPTAHAEVCCIREACSKLGTFSLVDHTLYTSCEPCSMCLSAAYWARISKIVYGNTRDDAAAIGFDDRFIYEQMSKRPSEQSMPMVQADREYTMDAFEEWSKKVDKIPY